MFKRALIMLLIGAETLSEYFKALIAENVMDTLVHCVKIVRIRSCAGPHFSAFGLDAERSRVCCVLGFGIGVIAFVSRGYNVAVYQ